MLASKLLGTNSQYSAPNNDNSSLYQQLQNGGGDQPNFDIPPPQHAPQQPRSYP